MKRSHTPHPGFLACSLLTGVLALTACSSPPVGQVTLLPDAQGRNTSVVVTTAKGQQVLNQPYQVARIDRQQALAVGATDAEQVNRNYPQLIALMPGKSQSFLLYFEPGRSQLTVDSLAQLPSVIQAARSRSGGEIVVTGHTDRQGPLEANDRLSLQRANAIRELLIGQGFRGDLIEAVGRGEREPVVPTEDEVAEPRNRRAEVIVR